MRATAYTASFKETGKMPGDSGYGITATGKRVQKGVIAVDPRVIPLYTRVYVEINGRTPDYGFAVAADVGGAIKGNKIDLFYDDIQYAKHFGVKKVKVYILSED
jgi:3D (Asp-Asp-Asp) domain-containing protein